jgi:hypothetical protein
MRRQAAPNALRILATTGLYAGANNNNSFCFLGCFSFAFLLGEFYFFRGLRNGKGHDVAPARAREVAD